MNPQTLDRTLAMHRALAGLAAAFLAPSLVLGQGSQSALDVSSPGAHVAFAVDDDAPGAAGTQADVGAADFTVELWLRGDLAQNPTAHAGGGVELPGSAWSDGNVVLDRSAEQTGRWYGVSVAGGFVRFGTGGGDGPGSESAHTLEGAVDVLDGAWHHVACVREAGTGIKRIFVDGVLDTESSADASTVDLSYPDDGVSGVPPANNPELYLGAPKDGADPDFAGVVDELRLWSHAADAEDVVSWFDRAAFPLQTALEADWRLEEGAGTAVASTGLGDPPSGVIHGAATWTSAFLNGEDVAPISHGLLPYGFHRELVLSGFVEATAMRFLPSGEVLLTERGGAVLRIDVSVDPPTTTTVLQVTPSLLTIEYGIVGMCLDPDFANNGWFYLHYTSDVPTDRVSRFTLPSGGVVDPASEVVLWENASVGPGHTGGTIVFGADGKLYIPTGDAFFPPNSQDLTNPNGKVLRINPDGSIPPDNPGASIPGADPAIWAWGLRNPFRSFVDPATGVLWIADVGGDDASAWEEVHHGQAGANYGWPDLEGPECQVADCSGMSAPFYGYRHNDPDLAPGLAAASITGGLVYDGGAFPAAYDGTYFYGDYATGWMRRLRLDGGGALIDAPLFIPVYTAGTVVDFAVDAAGDLWYLTVGLPWSGGDDEATLYRVSYTADDATPRSTVVLDTSPTGLFLNLDGYPITTPFVLETHVGAKHQVSAAIFQLHEPTGQTLSLACWSDGGDGVHQFTAPVGGSNLTAVYTSDGTGCETGHGFETYGHGVGGANTLGMVGGYGASPGAVMTTKVTSLPTAAGTLCWVGVAFGDWDFALFGGTILVDSFSQFATVSLPPVDGVATWQVPLPSQPGLSGATFYCQAMATDARQPAGLSFSNGLKVVLGP